MSKLKELLAKTSFKDVEERVAAEVGSQLHASIENVMAVFDAHAKAMADSGFMALPAAHELLGAAIVAQIKNRTPSAILDGRAQQWRCRVRLYKAGMSEPEADSDPDIDADKPGTLIIAGLPGVAEELGRTAREFHGANCAGLDMDTLRHRLKSLRPTLSRRGGDAVWRVPYRAPDGVEWLARVDIEHA